MSKFQVGDRVQMPGVPLVVQVLKVGTCSGEDCDYPDPEIFQFLDPQSGGNDWMHSSDFEKVR